MTTEPFTDLDHSNQIILLETGLWYTIKNKSGGQRIISSEDAEIYFCSVRPRCDRELEGSNPFLLVCLTLQPMMMHCHTEFG